MKKQTRQVFGQYETRLGQLNDTDNVAKTFSVTPSVQQKLENKMQESSEFLSKVNIIGVGEQEGEKLGLGVSGPIASRTNTKDKERETRDLSTLDGTKYRCEQTNFDTHLSYAKLDAWAKFPDFQSRVANAILTRQALDRIVIGFNGVKAMADTDLDANPLLQDVNKGWLQIAREQIPEQVLEQGATAGKITLGAGGDYENLDALVHDVKQMVDTVFRDGGDLIAIVGSDLLAHDKAKLYSNQAGKPTEKERIENQQVIATYGGLPSFSVPFFPVNAVTVTSFDNLSIYFQDSSWRKQTIDNPKRSRVEDYNSRNEGYVIEQLEKFAMTENVELVTA